MVGEGRLACVLCAVANVLDLFTTQCCCRVAFLERCFGGAHILALIAHVSFGCFIHLRVVFVDVLQGEYWPTYKIACLDCFNPHGFGGVLIYGMHPFDSMFDGR